MRHLWILPLMVFISLKAHAASGGGGFTIAVNPFYYSKTTTTSGTSTTTTSTYINPELGVTMSSGLYIGGHYQYETVQSGSTTTYSAFGPSIGYSSNCWNVIGTYLMSGVIDFGNNTKYQKGSGFRFAFGHDWMMGSNFFAGLQFMYTSLAYTEVTASGVTATVDYKYTEITPAFRLGVAF